MYLCRIGAREIITMTWIQTLVLALLQGVTELFPISSLGHTVIIPGLLGWTALVQSPTFLPVVVAFHLGTSVALVGYFWRDWLHVIRTLLRSVQEGQVKRGDSSWVSWLVIIGCIPAGLLGVLLEKPLKHLFASPLIAAAFLAVNGVLLLVGEAMRRRASAKLQNNKAIASATSQPGRPGGFPLAQGAAAGGFAGLTWEQNQIATLDTVPLPVTKTGKPSRPLETLTWKEAVIIGFAQSLALIPGISRSGSTMVAVSRSACRTRMPRTSRSCSAHP